MTCVTLRNGRHSVFTYRDRLKEQLSECGRIEVLRRQIDQEAVAADRAVDAAVREHEAFCAEIQSQLATETDPARRRELLADLTTANEQLEIKCKANRMKAQQLAAQSLQL